MRKIYRFCQYLLCVVKLIIAFVYVQINKKRLYAKDLWLIQEKITEARDNGYHLYKYIRTNHPEINAFFSITKNSVDRKKIEAYGNIIDGNTIRHYVYYLSAKKSIGSQKFGACPTPADWVNRFKCFRRRDQRVVFLQHGITKDAAQGLDYSKTNFDLFVCAAKPEHMFALSGLHYPKSNAQLLGFCRFDNLHVSEPEKTVLIMPTFRKWLAAKDRTKDATKEECDRFIESSFYKNYADLLSHEKLQKVVREKGYRIVFYMHYSLQSYTKVFKPYENDITVIASRMDYDVQQLMISSAVMVTDFSSVFFDFAYMKKPEVFFQFDEADYRKGHYQEGYFDYRRDAFGPVYTETNDTVDYITSLLENGCKMEKLYQDRVDQFFTFQDDRNCERNYNAIVNLK